ncbi:MAG: PorP/SprF family type IX secretion system membrane protein [Tunicatimonas sp.]
MKKYLLCVLIACTATSSGWAQRLPFFTHHVLNPYIYNPAFAGYDQSAVFYLTHRQQWFGVEGAPVSTHLSFHTPVGNNNPLSVGANLVHDRLGVLRHSAFKASAAYMVPLSAEAEHYLKAGFSAGIRLHQYSVFESPTAGDPAVARASQNGTALDGRFGVHYHYERLNVGIALPHLFTTAQNEPDGTGGVALDQFTRAIVSANYRFDLGAESNVTLVPTVLYHYAQESASQLEAVALVTFQDAFWVGGNYQQQLGYGGLAGFKMKNFRFGYHFGLGGSELASYASGTHEVQLSFMIGKKKVMMKRQPRLTTQTSDDAIPEAALKKDSRRRRRREKRRQKEEAAIPDRKKLPAERSKSEKNQPESFDDDSFKEVEEGIILMPSIQDVLKQPAPAEQTLKTAPKPKANKIDPSPAPPKELYDQDLNNTFEGEGTVDPWQGIEDESQAAPPPSFDESAERAVTTVKRVKSSHPLEMPGGIYLIAGTFSQRAYAERLARELAQQGYRTQVGYNTSKGYFYVSLFEADDMEEVKRRLYRARGNPKLQKAWVLVVE